MKKVKTKKSSFFCAMQMRCDADASAEYAYMIRSGKIDDDGCEND